MSDRATGEGSRLEPEEPLRDRLCQALGAFRTTDGMLALLRVAVFVGAAVWTVVAPVPTSVRVRCALLLGAFLGYGAVVLWLAQRWPARSRAIYLGALVADLAFLYFLFRETGGVASPFLPAAFLLAALTAFHHGPVLGVLAAWTALGLAMVSNVDPWPRPHWGELPLVFIFVTLTAGYVGWLARREAAERRDAERLRDELADRANDLGRAYEKCREVQDHLVHSERLATIGRMSAEMAHQVRNPLSAISLNLEMLEDDIAPAWDASRPEASKLIAAIHHEIDNLVEVTESYLNFAKLPPFKWEQASLNRMVEEILVLARPQIERADIKASQGLAEDLPRARVDRRQLKFAVMNLVSNALEAMSPGGRLRVATRTNGDHIEMAVSDTGLGIRAADMPKIFEPFFTTKQGGTGLGLSLVRRIVESHGGRIHCRSIHRVGTTFTISLPTNGCQDERGGTE